MGGNSGADKGIPEQWCITTLADLFLDPKSEIVDGPFGSNLKASEYMDSGVPILRIQNIERNLFINKNIKHITPQKAEKLERHCYRPGDVILTKLGDPLGKSCIIPESFPAGIVVADLVRLRLSHENINKKFLVYAINSSPIADQLKKLTKGTTRPRVNLGHIRSLKLKLPPKAEQHRIVTKIEELFSELDKGIESLNTARAKLNIYRQAVLKHAFEGKLTAQWREENKDKLETPEQLLARIKQEREARYEQQIQEWKAAVKKWEKGGKLGKRPTKPKRPRTFSDFAQNQPLTDIWPIFELGDLISVSSGQSLTSNAMRGGRYPVYGGNGINGYHDEYLVSEPTLILGRVGAKCGVTHITLENSWITDNALIASPLIRSFDKRYFKFLLEHKNLNILGSSTGQPVISGAKIYAVHISFPTLVEQIQIADTIEKADSSIDELTAEIDNQLLKADALRQSILKKAFSGQLVPQDPDDEPASSLLERIKAEKEKAAQNNHSKKTKKRKTTA